MKPQHYEALLGPTCPSGQPAWVEVHPQNYFGDGGPPHRWLTAIAEHYPLSFHSVGLSLGSADGLTDMIWTGSPYCASDINRRLFPTI